MFFFVVLLCCSAPVITESKDLSWDCCFCFMSSHHLWTCMVFVQIFGPFPAGFSRLLSLYSSLFLVSSLCLPPPPTTPFLPGSDLPTLPSLSCGWGVGVAEDRMGKLATLGSHTHRGIHDACNAYEEKDYRGNAVCGGNTQTDMLGDRFLLLAARIHKRHVLSKFVFWRCDVRNMSGFDLRLAISQTL